MRRSSGGTVKLSLSLKCCGGCAARVAAQTDKTSLLLLNPVTDGQFLTFLYNIKRLGIIAEAAYTNLFTINYIYRRSRTGQCTIL